MSLPNAPHQLNRMLAIRLCVAALVIGAAAGIVAYQVETRRVESIVLELAAGGARHLESPAMEVLSRGESPEEHRALTALLDKSNFVGIRVFDVKKELAYETWASLAPGLVDGLRKHRHDWPVPGRDHRNRIRIGDEHLIQVIIPLTRQSGSLDGYLEGTYRIDEGTLANQKQQILNGVLTAVIAVLATALLLYPLLLGLLQHATGLSRRLLDSNLSLIRSLGNAVAKRDSDTDAHNYRVTLYAVALAEKLHWPKGAIAHLIAGAFLHDVGKIGIPDHILLKPGKLTEEEFEIMKTHALLGLEIVAGNAWMNATPVIRNHHERFDGSGYPDGLRGMQIPQGARLFAVVDVFDALVSARPYKAPMPFETALALIENESGRHFDPEIVIAFSSIIDRLHQEVAMASEVELHAQLRSAIFRYFNTEAGAGDTTASPVSAIAEGAPS
ncbi:MAG: metal-dependent phosphohydrolase [Candidatus Accumulibacter sp. 66-26]|nr:HD domain-containing protein [Accumulibacter sp.]OJW46569.1 MAG: metal-dependent phosphohydrolase [Candidatus Accumulibacter sp. 66-26]